MKRLLLVMVVYTCCVLYFVFGASTTVPVSSPSYVTNLIRAFISGSLGSGKYVAISGTNIIGISTNSTTASYIPILPTSANAIYSLGIDSANGGSVSSNTPILFSLTFSVTGTNGNIIGILSMNSLKTTNIYFTNGVLAFPRGTGSIGTVLTMGTNELYWSTNAP